MQIATTRTLDTQMSDFKKMKEIDFKTKIVIRHEEEHFIMIKESHHREDISAITCTQQQSLRIY